MLCTKSSDVQIVNNPDWAHPLRVKFTHRLTDGKIHEVKEIDLNKDAALSLARKILRAYYQHGEVVEE